MLGEDLLERAPQGLHREFFQGVAVSSHRLQVHVHRSSLVEEHNSFGQSIFCTGDGWPNWLQKLQGGGESQQSQFGRWNSHPLAFGSFEDVPEVAIVTLAQPLHR